MYVLEIQDVTTAFLDWGMEVYLSGLPKRLRHLLVFLGNLVHKLLVLLFPLSHVGDLHRDDRQEDKVPARSDIINRRMLEEPERATCSQPTTAIRGEDLPRNNNTQCIRKRLILKVSCF